MNTIILVLYCIFSVFMVISSLVAAKNDDFKFNFYFISNKNFMNYICYGLFIFLLIFSKKSSSSHMNFPILSLSYIWLLFLLPFFKYIRKKDSTALGLSIIFFFLNIILSYIILG